MKKLIYKRINIAGVGYMKIGIDIDNVISNFNDTIVEAYLQHDKQLRNTGIINIEIHIN